MYDILMFLPKPSKQTTNTPVVSMAVILGTTLVHTFYSTHGMSLNVVNVLNSLTYPRESRLCIVKGSFSPIIIPFFASIS